MDFETTTMLVGLCITTVLSIIMLMHTNIR